MNFKDIGDSLWNYGSFKPSEPDMSELDAMHERRMFEIKQKEEKENKRFWLNFWLAIIAILISLSSVGLQCTQGSRIQEVRILKDTTQKSEPLDLSQSDRQKNQKPISSDSLNFNPTTSNSDSPKQIKNSH